MAKARIWSEEECAYLKENISYDPETGVLTWVRDMTATVKEGDECGFIHSSGYRRVGRKIKGVIFHYYAHRVAWYLYHNELPENLDHINRSKCDNRLVNLRAATRSENSGNMPLYKSNKSGAKGVYIKGDKYTSQIRIYNLKVHLGTFDTLEEAARSYDEAAVDRWGEFAYTNKEHGVY